jgi:4-hydroxybenzoate polyprenyltransferase
LSIDVAIGSAGSSILAVNAVNVQVSTAYWIILPLCVWIIYTADHLLDAFKLKEKASMGRHAFHFQHRKMIAFFLALASLFLVIFIPQHLNKNLIIYGIVNAVLIFAYLLLNHFVNRIFKFFPREIIISVGYMAGTWGIPLLVKYPLVHLTDWFFLVNHFFIILSIPLMYSMFEYKDDKVSGFISFATTFGIRSTGTVVAALLMISAIVSILSLFLLHTAVGLILVTMSFCLFIILIFKNILIKNERYRTLSDSVNFLPAFLLIK